MDSHQRFDSEHESLPASVEEDCSMNKNIAAIILLLTILVGCGAPKVNFPTQPVIPPSQTLLPPTGVLLPIGDGGLISGRPCQSPCFFGIRIGETPLNQVASSLKNNGISPCSMPSSTTVFCGENVTSIAIGSDPSTFIVDEIEYDPAVLITVEEIINKYGNPNFVRVTLDGIPERPKISALLLWDSIKMRIDLLEIDEKGEQGIVIESTAEIQWVFFLDETSYSNLTTDEYAHPWKGYGAYKP